MRLRQVALVAQELDAATERLGRLLGIGYGYDDPGIVHFGLRNWVAAIGDTFLEVVSPIQDGTTAGRFIERRGGDGGYMVLLQTGDLEVARRRLEDNDARIVWNAKGEGEDGETTEGLHVHPRDCGGAILSIDAAEPTDAWVWAGADWREHDSSFLNQIVGVEIQANDPEAMATRWGALLDVPARTGDGTWLLELGNDVGSAAQPGRIVFVAADDGRGEGVSALELAVGDRAALEEAARSAGASLERSGDALVTDAVGIRLIFR